MDEPEKIQPIKYKLTLKDLPIGVEPEGFNGPDEIMRVNLVDALRRIAELEDDISELKRIVRRLTDRDDF